MPASDPAPRTRYRLAQLGILAFSTKAVTDTYRDILHARAERNLSLGEYVRRWWRGELDHQRKP